MSTKLTENQKSFVFALTRAAMKGGGDRYEAEIGDVRPLVIYIPQFLSRADSNQPAAAFRVTFEKE